MEYLTRKIFAAYPDIDQVTSIYREVRSRDPMVVDTGDGGGGEEGDDKYRPLVLLLAVLYKLQDRNDGFFKTGGEHLEVGATRDWLEVAAFYWHQQHSLGKQLREGISSVDSEAAIRQLVERNRRRIVAALGLDSSEVAVSVSELCHGGGEGGGGGVVDTGRSLASHTPDHVVTVSPAHRAVVLTVLGTRIFPRPSTRDIIMDLAARPQPFLGGLAHGGMVVGATNLAKVALPPILEQLAAHPGYSLLVVGYSLGIYYLLKCFSPILKQNIFTIICARSGPGAAVPAGCPPRRAPRAAAGGCPGAGSAVRLPARVRGAAAEAARGHHGAGEL